MEFTITTSQLLWCISFLSAIWGAWKIVKEIKKPSQDLKAQVERNTELLKRDDARMRDIEKSNKLILQSLLVIINHDITGNGLDKMKESRDELQDYLINK